MTRHTATSRKVSIALTLRATGERDESDPYRHRWTTTARIGLPQETGPNIGEVREKLMTVLEALINSPGAVAALRAEQDARVKIYVVEAAALGPEAAMQRLRIRACGRDPDAPQVDRHEDQYPGDDS